MKRDVDLLYEIGALRLLNRQWSRFHLPGTANLADHHFRVAWIALIIAARESKNVDTGKIVKMALIHDIGESRTNDVDYLSRQYVDRHEDEAIADIFEATSLGEELVTLWHEYEKRESWEAKIVKDADNLDVDLELQEQASMGHTLKNLWKADRDNIAKKRLFTKSARRLRDEIYATSPHNWHITSPRNRINGGDWQNK